MARYSGRLRVAFLCGEVKETKVEVSGFIERLDSSIAPLLDELAEYAEECERHRKVFSMYKAYKMMSGYGKLTPGFIKGELEIFVDDAIIIDGEESEPDVLVGLHISNCPEEERRIFSQYYRSI